MALQIENIALQSEHIVSMGRCLECKSGSLIFHGGRPHADTSAFDMRKGRFPIARLELKRGEPVLEILRQVFHRDFGELL